MKAIPMRGRLKGKRISGFLTRSLCLLRLQPHQVAFGFDVDGATCKITLRDSKDRVLGTAIMALPHGRKK
jgi:hypothetical protein